MKTKFILVMITSVLLSTYVFALDYENTNSENKKTLKLNETTSKMRDCNTIIVTEHSSFFENFNDINEGIPNCWNNSEGTTANSSRKWTSYNDAEQGRSLRFDSYQYFSGKTNMLKTPTLDLTALNTGARLNFMYKNPKGGDFSIYLSTDGGVTYPTVLATNLTNQDDWVEYEILLPPEALTNNIVIVFKGTSNKIIGAYIHLDEVKISKLPPCPRITNLIASNITAYTADLTWTKGGSETNWNILVSDTKITDFTTKTPIALIENSYQATNLTPGTTYYFYVQAKCSDSELAEWQIPTTFKTLCDKVIVNDTSTFFEDFNDITKGIPDCWDNSEGTITESYRRWYSWDDNDQGRSLRCNSSYENIGKFNVLKTPVLDLTTLSTARLNFMYKNPIGGDFSIYLSTDGGITYPTILATNLTNQTTWVEKEIILPSEAISNNVIIVFKGTSNSVNGAYIHLDNVKISKAPTCNKITNLTASALNANTANITWTNGGGETNWNIIISKTEISDFSTVTPMTVTTNPYQATDLTPTTNYYVYVQAKCSNTDLAEWSKSATFETPCVTAVVDESSPFFEDFNDITKGIPNCWDNSEGTTPDYHKWKSCEDDIQGRCLKFSSDYNAFGRTNMLKTPILNLSNLPTARLNFMYKNPTGGDFSIYLSTDGGNTYPTELATDLTGQVNWLEKEIALPTQALTDNVVIVFKGTSNYDNHYTAYAYLDDVKVSKLPTCNKVTNLTVSNITANAAKLTWINGGSENAWNILVSETEIIDFSSVKATLTTTNPHSITGLESGTKYYVYVQAKCSEDDLAEWSNLMTFETPCVTVIVDETSDFFEDFNNTFTGIPLCWDNSEGTTTENSYKWSSYEPSEGDSVQGRCLKFNSYQNGTGKTSILKTPVLDLSALSSTEARLNFMYKNPIGVDFSIYLSTNGGTNFDTELAINIVQQDSWSEKEITLPAEALANDVVIVFIGTSNHGNGDAYIYLDDIRVSKKPTCAKITEITASAITANTIDLKWLAAGSEGDWNIIISKTEISDFTAEAPINLTENYYKATGLTPSTNYYVYVQAKCSNSLFSEWSSVKVFKTDCDLITVNESSPFEENFNNSTEISECFTLYDFDGDFKPFRITSLTSFGEGKGLYTSVNTSGNNDWLVTPHIELDDDNLAFKFYAKSTSSDYLEHYKVLVSKTTKDSVSFNILLEDVTAAPASWTEKKYKLSDYGINNGDQIYIAIQCISVDKISLYVDELSIYKQTDSPKEILTYSIPGQTIESQIDTDNHTITVTMPIGTNIMELIPTFTISENASIYVSGIEQISGTTPHNFSQPVIYTVKAEDGSTQYWTINVVTADLYTLSFTVINTDNTALENVTIHINNQNIITDVNGIATIKLLNGDYPFTAKASDYQEFNDSVTINYGNIRKDVIMTSAPKHTVNFNVRDTNNTALENVNININNQNLTTDINGIATIELANGDYAYTATHANYEELKSLVTIADTNITKSIIMKEIPKYTVTFNVKNASNTALENVNIKINNQNLTTDINGVATIELANGDYTYIVTLANYEELTGPITVSNDNVSKNLKMLAAYTVTFNIKDNNNIALENVTININNQNLTTDINGIATIELANGDYAYTTTLVNYNEFTGSITITDKDVTEDVIMTSAITYKVTFSTKDDNNIALKNVNINIINQNLTTDNNGLATIELANGEYAYKATLDNYVESIGSLTVTNADTTENVKLLPLHTVTFIVKDNNNKVLENANININNKKLTTDTNGVVTIKLTDGDYAYTATLSNYENVTGSVTVNNENVTEKVIMTPIVFYYTVIFNIKDANNAVLENAIININNQYLVTDANGVATIDLTNGDYFYTTNLTNYYEFTGFVKVADADVTENVAMTSVFVEYTVTFKVKDIDNKPLEDATININYEKLITNTNGVATIKLANGNYTYTATHADYGNFANSIAVSNADATENITLNSISISKTFNDVSITPNPTTGILTVTGFNLYTLEILDMTGRVLYRTNMKETKTTINIMSYQSGMYIVRLSKDGQVSNNKIIKQ